MTNILFTDKEHAWRIQKITFDFDVTDPLPMERAVFSSPDEWNWLTVSDILQRHNDATSKHPNFYEILECMKTMETLHRMIDLYRSGGSFICTPKTNMKNEVKAIQMLKVWIRFANKLHKLVGFSEKVEISNRLILKIARETHPTLFVMPKGERYYDDKKSVIVQLSPYEDNTKNLEKHALSPKCKTLKNRVKKFLSAEAVVI